jgi:hypothetical protein
LKQILAILLLCCYTISSNGIFISKHFCGGQLQTISYYKKISKCCCEGETVKMAKEDNCCNDVASFSKLSTDQNVYLDNVVLGNSDVADYLLPVVHLYHSYTAAKVFKNKCKIILHPPPNLYRVPLFVQHQSWKLDC